MPVSVEWYDDLDAVAADAAGALDRGAQGSLFDRLDWFRLTRKHILPDAKIAVARVSREWSSAWLFLIETAPRRAAPFASWYTLRFGPVLFGIGGESLLPRLYETVAERFDILELRPLFQQSGMMPGWASYPQLYSTNWSVDIGDRGFDAYWAGRPSRLRQTVNRKTRTHPIAIRIHRTFEQGIWAEYESVYAESWKPAEGSLPFLRELAELEGAAGNLRLGLARDPSSLAIAAQFWLVENGIATIHKLAHRESANEGSPGTLLSHAMFRSALEDDRVSRIDFGLGDEPYKADWMDRADPVWRIDAYRPFTRQGALGIARELGGRLVRRLRAG